MCSWILILTITLAAGADDRPAAANRLLDRAVQERQAAADPAEVQQLLNEADRLAAKREFDRAIELFERAYRLQPSNDAAYARLLVCKRAAGRLTADDREALVLIEQNEMHRISEVLTSVRLQLLQARQALKRGDTSAVTQLSKAATAQLDGLPPDVDVSEYRRQIRSVDQAARRQSVSQEKRKQKSSPDSIEPAAPSSGDPNGPAATEVERDASDEFRDGYVPTGELIEAGRSDRADYELHRAQRDLADDTARNRVNWLYEIMNAHNPPVGDVAYPADFGLRTQRRAKYRDGVIWQGPPEKGPDGRDYVTAIYDLAELAHPVPNFAGYYSGSPIMDVQARLDRYFLQTQSFIFRRDAQDLAEGLPLLPYFGGIDNTAVTVPYDIREVERIRAVLERTVSSPPPQP